MGVKKMGKAQKILVIEDEENMRMLISEELQDEGFDVEVASDAQEGLTLLTSKDYDLVTIDVEMPGMSGLEVAGLIRDKKIPVKIILLTAYSHYKADLSSWAADAYVVKSSDFTELKQAIADLSKL